MNVEEEVAHLHVAGEPLDHLLPAPVHEHAPGTNNVAFNQKSNIYSPFNYFLLLFIVQYNR